MSAKEKSKSGFLGKLPLWLVLLAGIAIGISAVVLIIDILVSFAGKDYGERLGVFGDFFGGVLNPIVSIVGFIAVLYTLNSQREDAEEQEKSVALANKTQIKQQFEGTLSLLMKNLEYEYTRIINNKYSFERPSLNPIDGITHAVVTYNENFSGENLDLYDYKYDFFSPTLQLYKNTRYSSVLNKILSLINDLNYPKLPIETIKDKNFYIDFILINIEIEIIFTYAFVYVEEDQIVNLNNHFKKSKSFEAKNLITTLGLLRTIEYSPFNKEKYYESNTLPVNEHLITKCLVETFGEQAFKPIEIPPASP